MILFFPRHLEHIYLHNPQHFEQYQIYQVFLQLIQYDDGTLHLGQFQILVYVFFLQKTNN